MKKYKFLASTLSFAALTGAATVICCSCNKKQSGIDASEVEHGRIEYPEIKLDEKLVIKYIPDKGYEMDDYVRVFVNGKELVRDTQEQEGDFRVDFNQSTITIFSFAVTSTSIKVVIKAKVKTNEFSLFYQHLLPNDTKQYFEWDSTNPSVCDKKSKSVTIKIKKLKDWTSTDIQNPVIVPYSTYTVQPRSISLDISGWQAGQTKEFTFTWDVENPTDIAFIVEIDSVYIKRELTTSQKKWFSFVEAETPYFINALNTTLSFKCILSNVPGTIDTVKVVATLIGSGEYTPKSYALDKSSSAEQTVSFTNIPQNLNTIVLSVEAN